MGETQPDPGAVDDIPFLAKLPLDERERLLANAKVERFEPGQVIIERAEPARAMYVVTQGTARVDVGGRYHDLKRGALLGEMGLLSSKPRMRTRSRC
jgi:CRP-like cAMP-binding protein